MAPTPTPTAARTAFDHALELHALREAADAYALRHGELGSTAHRAAWLNFRLRIRSIQDLRRAQDKARGRRASQAA